MSIQMDVGGGEGYVEVSQGHRRDGAWRSNAHVAVLAKHGSFGETPLILSHQAVPVTGAIWECETAALAC